ncbi:polyprenyl synthetase [candidate division KSB3 bacterium]|uniref:Polyprenyl synthetase n=1 Tax=candidate division KSB3 bacterium TaxID=2044937 RepID=A0A2G6E3R6_9BACT|nr:MAG: polyprenyl synthetase [candidate division KSB3 bacterium]PIE29309.1 MAG: polyprenyl synthetase [candidate division KSB3 bacterium]
MTQSLQDVLSEKRRIVDAVLEKYLPPVCEKPSVIHEAMRYSMTAGGKRLRPIVLLMTAELFGKRAEDFAFAAAAVEMVHGYSLIHDDLPAMDDDDLRRGKPTNHKVYGEAIAILAGDALLTLAFRTLNDPVHTTRFSPEVLLAAGHELALAAGTAGMLGGQVLDLQAEGRTISAKELEAIHRWKTGKLLTASLRIGAILSAAEKPHLDALTRYGEGIGLAFQVVDDILDLEGNAEELGKNPERDLQKEKSTYPALFGLDESKKIAGTLINDARQALSLFGERARRLEQLAEYIYTRRH